MQSRRAGSLTAKNRALQKRYNVLCCFVQGVASGPPCRSAIECPPVFFRTGFWFAGSYRPKRRAYWPFHGYRAAIFPTPNTAVRLGLGPEAGLLFADKLGVRFFEYTTEAGPVGIGQDSRLGQLFEDLAAFAPLGEVFQSACRLSASSDFSRKPSIKISSSCRAAVGRVQAGGWLAGA